MKAQNRLLYLVFALQTQLNVGHFDFCHELFRFPEMVSRSIDVLLFALF